MKISYSEKVDTCYFTLKPIPANDFRQISISYDINMSPQATYSEGMDSFGNKQIIGRIIEPHSEYLFTIKGLVETRPLCTIGGVQNSTLGMYKYPHGKCIPGDNIISFSNEIRAEIDRCASTREKCICIMDRLHEKMIYEQGSTQVETTSEESFSEGKGVCQDFSHIFICLLRIFGIPARYTCGLIVGEGKSHSWVEAACNDIFIAFDPTHNCEITDEYIKLGVGRDAVDCAINRGVMWGGGIQTQAVQVSVEKYY